MLPIWMRSGLFDATKLADFPSTLKKKQPKAGKPSKYTYGFFSQLAERNN